MSNLSRREFLKLTGVGAAAAAVLSGCGPAARYVTRRPYGNMPEYNQTGESTYYATTCRECPAGCGLVVRTLEGRAIKVEGNPQHPVNRGRVCSRGLTSVQGLYNPDRIQAPRRNASRGGSQYTELDWDAAVAQVAEVFRQSPGETAFLFSLTPDHLFDLANELTQALGAPAPLRYSSLGMFEGRATLLEAVKSMYGQEGLPSFDLAGADVIFSFGANFLETWLSPVTYSRAYGHMRQGTEGRRGYLVSFEPRQSMTSGSADEWVPLTPGSEGLVAAALASLVAGLRGGTPPEALGKVDLDAVAEVSGVSPAQLQALAQRFAAAERPLAVPGGGALGHKNGLTAARAVLALNILVDNLGRSGGVFLVPGEASGSDLRSIQDLVARMQAGKVKALFIHGTNPIFELPPALGFAEALTNVPLVVSFASFEDETAQQSDLVLPDHTGLESWGYQRVLPGSDRKAFSGIQPVVAPLYQTRATADVLLAAVQAVGGELAGKLPYPDEVAFLQQRLLPLLNAGGFYTAPEILTFWSRWLQFGGWWLPDAGLDKPLAQWKEPLALDPMEVPLAQGEDLHLVIFATQMGDGSGANRPWLQETPDPTTTVMWNSWVEISPEKAKELGVRDDDVVLISSPAGEVEAVVYLYPAIRPDTIAIPFGQGHTALGRYAAGRGCNPAKLLEVVINEAGDLAYGDTFVKVTPTGRRRPLARFENRHGVYGDHE